MPWLIAGRLKKYCLASKLGWTKAGKRPCLAVRGLQPAGPLGQGNLLAEAGGNIMYYLYIPIYIHLKSGNYEKNYDDDFTGFSPLLFRL
jgi:hypothetical protein